MRRALHHGCFEIRHGVAVVVEGDAAPRATIYQRSIKDRLTLAVWRTRCAPRLVQPTPTLIAFARSIDFNLDFYTEVQDLTYLENTLNASPPLKFAALNMAMISLIENFSLAGFETLAVEDKNSMLHLMRVIDRANGL